MKKVQMDYELFRKLIFYHLGSDDQYEEDIRNGLEEKLDALVRHELYTKDMITPPKTPKSNRQISIPPFLAEELKEYCSMLYGITANERMFRFTKSFMEHEMVRGIKETGVRRIRLHDLRHSHV